MNFPAQAFGQGADSGLGGAINSAAKCEYLDPEYRSYIDALIRACFSCFYRHQINSEGRPYKMYFSPMVKAVEVGETAV